MEALSIANVVDQLRATFHTGRTRPLSWRKAQLRRLRALLAEQEGEILAALEADLRKPVFEAYASEVGMLKSEIDHTLKHLARWTRPERVGAPIKAKLFNFKASNWIYRDPLGVVLIIGPWNYPFQLLIAPLIGAIAAGNCAVLKPSEITEHTSRLVVDLIGRYLDPDCVRVVEGGVPETTALLDERFDHIFFTGSTAVGRIVAQAAAKHLTPVTLELGGKSPAIVDEKVDLEVAARRIAWGKFFNAGQTCVAPDYALVHERVMDPFCEALRRSIESHFGSDPQASPDLARIVSERHHDRLCKLLEGSGRTVVGGTHDRAQRYIAPTVLRDVPLDAPVMQEEIFGPILPVLSVENMEQAIAFVNERPKPLALYVFSSNQGTAERVLTQTSSGGACVNDTISHLTDPNLPFGGVGDSGYGAYHGQASFEVFTHRKSVLDRATWVDLKLRYPPYADSALQMVKRLLG